VVDAEGNDLGGKFVAYLEQKGHTQRQSNPPTVVEGLSLPVEEVHKA